MCVFFVPRENQWEWRLFQGSPELFAPSVMREREELWRRDWLSLILYCMPHSPKNHYCACMEMLKWKWDFNTVWETIISSTAFQIQILNKTQSLAAFGCEQFRKQGFAGGLLKYKYIKESLLLHSVFQRPEKSASDDHLPCRWSWCFCLRFVLATNQM